MENQFHSLINVENITMLLGMIFLLTLFIGLLDFSRDIERIGK